MIRQRLFTQFVRNNKVAESIYKEDKLELPGSPFHSERKTPTQLYRNSTHQTKTVFDTDLVLTVGHSELTKIQLKNLGIWYSPGSKYILKIVWNFLSVRMVWSCVTKL